MKFFDKVLDIFMVSGNTIKDRFNRINIDKTDGKLEIKPDGITTKATFNPNAAAAVTPYVYDTAIAHTSGNLFEVKNNGVIKFNVDWGGSIVSKEWVKTTLGIRNDSAEQYSKIGMTSLGTIISRNQATGDALTVDLYDGSTSGNILNLRSGASGSEVTKVTVDKDGNITAAGSISPATGYIPQIYTDAIDETAGAGGAKLQFLASGLVASQNKASGTVFLANQLNTSNNDVMFGLQVNSVTKMSCSPNALATVTPYSFDTVIAHTGGNLFEINNGGAEKVKIDYNGYLMIGKVQTKSGGAYGEINMATSGMIISRNQTTGDAITIQLKDGSASGNILNLQSGATPATVFNVRKDGITDMVNNLNIFSNSADALANGLDFEKSRGTFGTPTIVSANDALGEVNFTGHDGTNYIDAAQIRCIATGTPGTNRVGGQLEFWTHPDSTGAMVRAGYIDNAGKLTFSGSGAFTNLYANTMIISRTGLATTATHVYYAQNNTNATAGTPVQYAPGWYNKGSAWDTTLTASHDVEFRNYTVPISGNPVTGRQTWQAQINGAGYSDIMYLYNNGDLVNTGSHSIYSNSADALSKSIDFNKSRGTFAAPTIVSANDVLGEVNFTGHDGTNYIDAAQIRCITTGTPGTNRVGGLLEFWIHPDSTGALAQAGYVDSGRRLVWLSSIFVSSNSFDNRFNGIGTTETTGYLARNDTAAIALTPVQISPSELFSGYAWEDNLLESQQVEFRNHTVPISGNPVTGRQTWQARINGTSGTWGDIMYLYDNGELNTAGGYSTTSSSSDAVGNSLDLYKSRASGIVLANDVMGEVNFYGKDDAGTDVQAAQIRCLATGTPGTNRVGGQLEFWVHSDSTGVMARAGYIQNSKSLVWNAGASFSGTFVNSRNNIQETATTGFLLQNTSNSSAVTLVQYSPTWNSLGSAWEDNLLESHDVEFRNHTVPISGNPVTGRQTWQARINGTSGTWGDIMYLYDNGVLEYTAPTTDVKTKTASYTATSADHVIIADGTSAIVTVTLPTAVGITGREYVIKCIDDTFTVTVATTSSQNIDGSTTSVLSQWDCAVVVSDGANWIII